MFRDILSFHAHFSASLHPWHILAHVGEDSPKAVGPALMSRQW